MPVKAHAWVAGQVPSRGHTRGNHTLMFLSLSPSLALSIKKKKRKKEKRKLKKSKFMISEIRTLAENI